jgi:hypothetical protein
MGRWEEVDDDGNVDAKSQNTKRMSRDQIQNTQSKGTGLPGN